MTASLSYLPNIAAAHGREANVDMLHRLMTCDAKNGMLIWRARTADIFPGSKEEAEKACRRWNMQFSGRRALNCLSDRGYLHGRIFDVSYRAHRVIWAMTYGEWPLSSIDHINGNRADNRTDNLRLVSVLENQRNQKRSSRNSTGVMGVYRVASGGWRAAIGVRGKMVHLGCFSRFSDAESARKAAEAAYGFHPNHGRAP